MINYFGIRHHGPGSCRNVKKALENLKPDLILLEGPEEATELVKMVLHPEMKPPVAILAFQSDKVDNASFFPFAEFSPEWQTLCYAMKNDVDCKFFDLPLSYMMANKEEFKDNEPNIDFLRVADPFDMLAKIEKLPNGEAWWDTHVERAANPDFIFPAVEMAVTELRQNLPQNTSKFDKIREAWMRRSIRTAENDGYKNIAVVCGAWHVPGIKANIPQKTDNELLKGLKKVKVEVTWIPWTHSRLMQKSGYGAGIEYPGWYKHIYEHPNDDGTFWITKAAKILREKHLDISVAHVIDAVKLSNALTKIRNLKIPSPKEFNDAMVSVFSQGDDYILTYLRRKLLIDNQLGQVPKEVPKVPLLADFEKIQKRLKIGFTKGSKELTLDLRKPLDLERSTFFYRLKLMKLNWAKQQKIEGKGTFKESWELVYKPELNLQIIEMAIFGNTVEEASYTLAKTTADNAKKISEITNLLDDVVPADLPQMAEYLTKKLDSVSIVSTDITEMMDAVPKLSNIVLYGNVRNKNYTEISQILYSFIVRITASGTEPCEKIDEEQATEIIEKITQMDMSIGSLNDDYYISLMNRYLNKLRNVKEVNPMISGFASRMLYDKTIITTTEMLTSMSFYTSTANKPNEIAYWFEGFFRKSGTILLLDDKLWMMLNSWIQSLDYEKFIEFLPIMRRTFSSYSSSEKEKLAQKARTFEPNKMLKKETAENFNYEDAQKVIPLIKKFLGL